MAGQATVVSDVLSNLVGIDEHLKSAFRGSERLNQQWSLMHSLTTAVGAGALAFVSKMSGASVSVATMVNEIKAAKDSLHEPGGGFIPEEAITELEMTVASHRRMLEQFAAIQGVTAEELIKGGSERIKQLHQEEQSLTKLIEASRARNNLVTELQKISSEDAKWLSATSALLLNADHSYRDINEAAIESNSLLMARYQLVSDIQQAQLETGAELDALKPVFVALIERGRDLEGSFKDDVVAVTMLNQALSISVSHGAELVSAFRVLGTDVQKVGDLVSRVTQGTALSADEAARYAAELGRAMNVIRPASQLLETGNIEYLLKLEGQLKSLTGHSGEMIEFHKKLLTTAEGAAIAQMLGVNPEDLVKDNVKGQQIVTEALARLIENATSGQSRLARLTTMQAWSQQLGISANVLDKLLVATKKANAELDVTPTLLETWRNQMGSTFGIFGTVLHKFTALAAKIFEPLSLALAVVGKGLSYVLDIFSKLEYAIYAAQIALIIALPSAFRQIYKLVATLHLLAVAARDAAKHSLEAAIAKKAETAADRLSKAYKMGGGDAAADILLGGGRGAAAKTSQQASVNLAMRIKDWLTTSVGSWAGLTKMFGSLGTMLAGKFTMLVAAVKGIATVIGTIISAALSPFVIIASVIAGALAALSYWWRYKVEQESAKKVQQIMDWRASDDMWRKHVGDRIRETLGQQNLGSYEASIAADRAALMDKVARGELTRAELETKMDQYRLQSAEFANSQFIKKVEQGTGTNKDRDYFLQLIDLTEKQLDQSIKSSQVEQEARRRAERQKAYKERSGWEVLRENSTHSMGSWNTAIIR